MGERTEIAWTDHTFNPYIGCTQVSAACDFCYAKALAERYGWVEWNGPPKRTSASTWAKPRAWNRKAAIDGVRRRVFCASLADVFDNQAPEEWRADLFDIIRETTHLDWQLLTKRPQNIKKMLPADWGDGWPNVWLGTTVENQEEAERRIWPLILTPAALHFLSCEPLLGPLDLRQWISPPYGFGCTVPGWVIVGGESGPHARPMKIEWAGAIRDLCADSDVRFFFKQWGGARPTSGGHLLDGREHREFPS